MKKTNLLMTAIAIFGFATITMAQNVRAWGTYYTGTGQVWPNGEDRGSSCITDAAGNVYMVGFTSSNSDIATTGAHQTVHAGGPIVFGTGGYDAFLVKFNSSGVRQWATYYGGSQDDMGISCAVDASGNVYMIGSTSSTSGIATAGAHETTINDGFLVKFNSSGVRQWGTYYGGVGPDDGFSCTTDASGNVYMTGQAQQQMAASGIATPGSHQSAYGGGYSDGFLVKFDSNGLRQWGTYYGGSLLDVSFSCATDASGNVYMSGNTQSSAGIATSGAHQTTFNDAFLVSFNSSGVRQSGTYYGGIKNVCTSDASGNVYMTGYTQSNSDIATAGAHQTANGNNGYSDAFLVKFNGISVGINETINDKLFSIYPNPAQSIVNVKADAKLIGTVYNIYDNTGKVVLSGTINAENTNVELGNLSVGIGYSISGNPNLEVASGLNFIFEKDLPAINYFNQLLATLS